MALQGIQVLELSGLAPAPFCGMVLSDFGAKVIRIDKLTGMGFEGENILAHGKLSVALNLKTRDGIDAFKKLALKSDVVIDPFRPGVMERLNLGPSELMESNNRLIYARLTGYGQNGPMASMAGHDINYVAMSGALPFFGGRAKAPSPPVNVLADFAGGGLLATLGIAMALYERQSSGRGQVIDCSMSRGAAYVSSWLIRGLNTPLFSNTRGENLLDGGTFFYSTYETKDNKFMAVGALEPKFFKNLLIGLNISEDQLSQTSDPEHGRLVLSNAFSMQDQEHWTKVFMELDACVTPVLSPEDAACEKHSSHQKNFAYFPDGTLSPAPEPRMSRTPANREGKERAPRLGEHTIDVLGSIGYTDTQLRKMLRDQAIATQETPWNS